jgi:uncharacterized hydrophobic protein (TIGR00271 family)
MSIKVQDFDFRVSIDKRESIYQSILKSSEPNPEYFMLLGLAALIALFGLLQNSVAVIIGAMLISPLMNPILSSALALLLGDGKLGRKSAIVAAVSVAGAIAITWFIAWLTPLRETTPEILARTSPNLLDLFIAFLSGLAGTLALRSESGGLTILPGVAIAVSLIPPLAVVGYGLSVHQGSVAGGAFLLFVTNLVAIILSAAMVFLLMGFRPHKEKEEGRFKLEYRMGVSVLVLVILSIPLFQTLRKAVVQVGLRSDVTAVLIDALKSKVNTISNLAISQSKDGLRVHATLQTTRYFHADEIERAEASLRKRFGPTAHLDIDQILVAQGGVKPEEAAPAQNPISGGVVRPVAKEAPVDFAATSTTLIESLQKHIDEVLQGTPIHQAGELKAEWGESPPLAVKLQLLAPAVIDSQTVSLLAAQLSAKLSYPVQLHGDAQILDPAYNLTLTSPNSNGRLGRADRLSVTKLVSLVRERPDLRLKISYESGSENSANVHVPILVSDIESLLAHSRLKPSKWNLQPLPQLVPLPLSSTAPKGPAVSPAGAKPDQTISTVHCKIEIFQEF